MNLDRYFDTIMEQACGVCVYPEILTEQDDLERKCNICPLCKKVKETLEELEHASYCTAERAVRSRIREGSGKHGR